MNHCDQWVVFLQPEPTIFTLYDTHDCSLVLINRLMKLKVVVVKPCTRSHLSIKGTMRPITKVSI